MARNLLRRFNDENEYKSQKCSLDIKTISLMNDTKEVKTMNWFIDKKTVKAR